MQIMTTTPVSDMMATWLQSGGVQAAGADRLATRISGDEMLSASAGTNSSAVWGCGAPADEAVMPAMSNDEVLSASAVSNNSSTWGCTGGADEAVMSAASGESNRDNWSMSGDEGLSASAATMPGQMFCSPAPQ